MAEVSLSAPVRTVAADPQEAPPAVVDLELRVPPDVAHFTKAPVPFMWNVTLPVEAGDTVYLTGSIAGVPISARTVVPREFHIERPFPQDLAGDSLTLVTRYEVSGDGVAGVLVRYETSSSAPADARVRGTSGEFRLLRDAGPLEFWGLNEDAVRFLVDGVVQGNIDGALGYFGAALLDTVIPSRQ